jgi:hypothetical protein
LAFLIVVEEQIFTKKEIPISIGHNARPSQKPIFIIGDKSILGKDRGLISNCCVWFEEGITSYGALIAKLWFDLVVRLAAAHRYMITDYKF